MRSLKILFLVSCVILSTFVISVAQKASRSKKSKSNKPLIKQLFKPEPKFYDCYLPPSVVLQLNKTEIVAQSPIENSLPKTKPDDSAQFIDASAFTNSQSEKILYKYKVSAGKIVGYGAKVVWDLSGIKAGSYTVSVQIDDGSGVIKPVTREITIVESSDCKF